VINVVTSSQNFIANGIYSSCLTGDSIDQKKPSEKLIKLAKRAETLT
jgi:hypothetical protein